MAEGFGERCEFLAADLRGVDALDYGGVVAVDVNLSVGSNLAEQSSVSETGRVGDCNKRFFDEIIKLPREKHF